jgi:hypothetical protein
VTRRTVLGAAAAGQVLPERPDRPSAGRFIRSWWYAPGLENANPATNSRFRVNAPEAALHLEFGSRPEVRSSGMVHIRVEEDLRLLAGAELYLELWGGHPGTLQKRVTPNGRTTYWLPEAGTAAGHCTHQYPLVHLKLSDLVPGYNALQFGCDQGPSFWGHYIVEQACVRAVLPAAHPDLKRAEWEGFGPRVTARPRPGGEGYLLGLDAAPARAARIARVDYQGFYSGYDENGDGSGRDWHGFTKQRAPMAILGSSAQPPFEVSWDTAMLPAQAGVSVRAVLHLAGFPQLTYETAALPGLEIGAGRASQVSLFALRDKPVPFWSRAGNRKTAAIPLDLDPARMERAELHTVVWDGGRGKVEEYFRLNGRFFPVAGSGRHDTIYTVLPLSPGLLRRGRNEIELLSDTDHHGIEVLEPGPALMVRHR